MLTNADIVDLINFRRELHRWPEVSGEEVETAKRIQRALADLAPAEIIPNIGGHGVAAIFDSGNPGETVLFRAELDALPIHEISENEWRSAVPGKGHLCGHDGHMTMLLGLGRLLKRNPVKSGRVVLMFQPSEEDGKGARLVVADEAYARISPDWAFAIHVEPGRAFGTVATRPGLINCASQGLKISFKGKTAHAATPEDGISPIKCVSSLMPKLEALGQGGELDDDFRLATITHVNIGEPSFGIAPGDATIQVTLRAASDNGVNEMMLKARDLCLAIASKAHLKADFEVFDTFAASINDPEAVHVAKRAMDAMGIPHHSEGLPMRASEDFGVFGRNSKAAMLSLGPGETYPALHNPDYDFPDDLLPVGTHLFERIAHDILDDDLKR